jgi:hypothetical protein
LHRSQSPGSVEAYHAKLRGVVGENAVGKHCAFVTTAAKYTVSHAAVLIKGASCYGNVLISDYRSTISCGRLIFTEDTVSDAAVTY